MLADPRTRMTILAAAAVAAVLGMGIGVDDRFLLKVLTFVGMNVIIVVGLALLFGYAGQISLGHAAFYGIGAYTSGVLTTAYGWPWLGAMAAGVVLASAVGLVVAVPSLRLKGHYLAMATLGVGEIVFVMFVEWRGITGGPDGLGGIPAPSLLGLEISGPRPHYWLVWGVALLALGAAALIVRSRPGRALRALHGTELGAAACGIDVQRSKIQVFVLSAALAGLAGGLYAHFVGFISPSSFSLQFSIILVAMVVLGGTGSLAGSVAGAVLLTLLPFADAVIPGLPREVASFLQDIEGDVYGLTLILVMLFVPGGIGAFVRKLLRGMTTRSSTRSADGGEAA